MRDELNRYLAAHADDIGSVWTQQSVSLLAADRPNSLWYTEGRVQEIRRDYEVQIESLKRLLALRTSAMHRVAEENEVLRAERKVN